MPTLVFKIPDKTAPGFLRRQMEAIDYSLAWQRVKTASADCSAENFQAMRAAWAETAEYLLAYVVEPVDRDTARQALLDASEDVIDQALALLNGKSADVPLSSKPDSSTG